MNRLEPLFGSSRWYVEILFEGCECFSQRFGSYTLEEIVALANFRDDYAAQGLTFAQLVDDLMSLDHCLTW